MSEETFHQHCRTDQLFPSTYHSFAPSKAIKIALTQFHQCPHKNEKLGHAETYGCVPVYMCVPVCICAYVYVCVHASVYM